MPLTLALMTWSLGFVASNPSAASTPTRISIPRSGCEAAFGADRPAALYPWPRPTDQMIEALRRLNADGEFNASQRGRSILKQSNPTAIIRDLFLPLTLAEVRRYFGPSAEALPPTHPQRYDVFGHRRLIARALTFVTEPELRAEWIRFMSRDPDRETRREVARAYLNSLPRDARDAHLSRALEQPVPDDDILRAAIEAPAKISAGVRWRLIQRLARRDFDDAALLTAINTLPSSDLAHAWYHDHLIVRNLRRALVRYDPGLQDVQRLPRPGEPPFPDAAHPATAHDSAAFDYAFDLVSLNSVHLRAKQIAFLNYVATLNDERRAFALDIESHAARLETPPARLDYDDHALAEYRRILDAADAPSVLTGPADLSTPNHADEF